MADFYGHDYKRDRVRELRKIEQLMMPDTYLPRKHRKRRMPQRKPRLTATESNVVYTTESSPQQKV